MEKITVFNTGTNITTSATSQRVAIPNASSGLLPKYVRVAAVVQCAVKVGNSTVTATAADVLVQPADSVVLRTAGCTHIAAIQGSGPGLLNIVPLEDM